MKKHSNILTSIFVLLFTTSLMAQDNPLWLRYPAISPDGSTILFNYQGDIYKVAASGGAAVPITISESYEFAAVWSNDGSKIAFASDRYGNFDVFVMPATGGQAERLTFHSGKEIPSSFTPDDMSVVFSAARQDIYTNAQFPSGVMAELYSVPVKGGRVSQILSSPAHDATYSHDGKKIIYHDRKGYENDWRKHHTSAVTRDIWVYDIASKNLNQLSHFEGENRDPVFASNDDDFYFLSEETGSFNIQKSSLSNPKESVSQTNFKHHPVRFLSRANNNTLCFSYHGEIYTMSEAGEPEKINIQLNYDGRGTLEKIVKVNKSFTESSLSPNGKEFAYVFRGEIFVSSIEHGTTKRITNTPWQERSVSFSPDGKSLVYAAEVEDSWNIYSKSIIRDEETYFFTSTILREDTIVATSAEEFQPAYSPDGKEVAFLENRTTLRVVNLDSKATRTILSADHNYSYADGDQYYQWSPDSKWFLVSYGPKERIFWGEVGLIEASGKGELRNLTKSGFGDFAPKWTMDGKMMIWGSTREGNRGASGFINSADVYGMFFKQETFDRFNLTKEELELLKEKEKKDKEDKKKDDDKDDTEDGDDKDGAKDENKKDSKKDKKGNDDTKSDSTDAKADTDESDDDDSEKVKDLEFDWDNMSDRKRRLTINTSTIRDWILSKDGDKLYYVTRFEGKNDIWSTDLKSKETKLFAKLGAGSTSMELSKDGKFILVLADGKAVKVSTDDGKAKPISTKGEMVLKQAEERAYIFDHAWRQVREKFFVVDMQGVDWDFYKEEYIKFLPYINNSYDFAEMLSEMLGELNASHTGSGYRPRFENGDQTASLGILYDYAHEDNGVLIAEVLKGGPLDKAKSKVKAGNIIEKIDGEAITPDTDIYKYLNRKVGKNILLSMQDPASGEKWDEVVKPISLGQENQLLYKRWVETRREEVTRLSAGKLGYVHVRGMNDASMRTVFEEALGRHIACDALIVDTRFNGGGNLHDALSDFLSGKKYFDVIPHGQYIGSQPWNRWIKPSIVIMGESNYSDAHLFPVAYKIKDAGKTLGMPVPGTGTFVWWETQIDPTIYFGIPMGGWKPLDGPFLENHQLEPDIRVQNKPDEMAAGRDQQLEEAVKELQKAGKS